MKRTYQKFFYDNFLSLILFFAVVAVVFLSYYRFLVRHDYIVGYEGICDPAMDKCFVGIDDLSGDLYYYTKMQKYEPDLYMECGADISDCDDANRCLVSDRNCSVIYCEENIKNEDEECSSQVEKFNASDKDNLDFFVEDIILQDNTEHNK